MLVAIISLLLIFILFGVPIAFSLGIAALGGILYDGTIPFVAIPQRIFGSIDSFALIAIPLFLLMGNLMEEGDITVKLVRLSDAIVGRFRGALAIVNIAAGIFMAGISGSAVADCASIGSMLIPAMKKEKYGAAFSAAVTAASATLGPIIPPSILMIIYGVLAGVSIVRLFLAGVIPGLVCGLGMIVVAYITARKRNYPKHGKISLKEAFSAFKDAIIPLFLPVVIVLGAVGGVFTITESAGIAALYAFVVSVLIYRKRDRTRLYRVFIKTVVASATVGILISTSGLFAWVLTIGGAPKYITLFITSISNNPVFILFLINVYLIGVGMLLAPAAGVVMSVPILIPLGNAIGLDPIHMGLMIVFNLNMGLLTPPVAITLQLASKIAGVPMEMTFKEVIPYLVVCLITLGLITYWSDFTLFFPHLILGARLK